jgi:hypothetical protein
MENLLVIPQNDCVNYFNFSPIHLPSPPQFYMIHAWRHGSLQQWRISMHPCWRVCGKNLNILSTCAVSPVVNTSNISSRKKNLFSFPVSVYNFIKVGPFGFLVINVCNRGEYYKTPCIYVCIIRYWWRSQMVKMLNLLSGSRKNT